METSVIIVSYNTKKLTLQTIKSIEQENVEIIIIDNNSKDGSLKELQRLAKEKKIKLIENSSNTGFAFANNQGIKKACGKYIFLLNSDTKVKKGAVKKLVDFAKKTPDAGFISARLLNADGSVQASCLYFPTIFNAIREYWFNQKGLFEKFAPKGKVAVEVEASVAAAALVTPKGIKKVGLLDERYFFYFEDIDYCRRIKKAGMKIYYLPAAEVTHYHGMSGKKIADEGNQWRRLIPSSKIYHGVLKHYLLTAVLWFGQKWQKLLKK